MGGPVGTGGPTGGCAGPLVLLFMYNICGTGAPFIVVLLVPVVVVVEVLLFVVLLSTGLVVLGVACAGLAVLSVTGVLDLFPEAAVSFDLDPEELSTVELDTLSAPAAVDGGFEALPPLSATPFVNPAALLDAV